MDELKTLKDIATAFVNGKNEIRGVREDELRKEAIKWIKGANLYEFGIREPDYVRKWIKHFFNITESELEDGR